MKSPPIQYTDSQARKLTEEFIAEHAVGGVAAKPGGKVKKQSKRK
jgi:hypothetical protein